MDKNLDEWQKESVNGFYKKVGTALLDKVGGSSGPLYGSFFMKFGLPVKTKGPDDGVTFDEFIEMMETGVNIIKDVYKRQSTHRAMTNSRSDPQNIPRVIERSESTWGAMGVSTEMATSRL